MEGPLFSSVQPLFSGVAPTFSSVRLIFSGVGPLFSFAESISLPSCVFRGQAEMVLRFGSRYRRRARNKSRNAVSTDLVEESVVGEVIALA